ncbi:hypothetical protein LJY25_15205 [Hymenobacter sp. BT175]|uniref:hypothetical protein n=1 Tax=Hymenobacter translucens TaxID=2886507 RepID=UPI001D0E03EA|nr:hypothetical protein [Hymenobacter translucens]MCC2547798.1 hypothetical protein [Hymenobacter translucens]
MRQLLSLLLVASLFVWAGMVAGISFLEAPLKFTAPHITVALGVGIGRIVFHALNKVEIGLCALAIISAGYLRVPRRVALGLGLLGLILLLQTFWLLPALDVRAEALLSGNAPPPNYQHLLYIVADALKLLLLLGTATLAYFALTPYAEPTPQIRQVA